MCSVIVSLVLVVSCLDIRALETPPPNCEDSLLRPEVLPDSAFTATSNSEVNDQLSGGGTDGGPDYSAKTARDIYTGGWCPVSKVADDFSEYIQIDMGAVNVVSKIAFGGRSGVAYTPSFVIRYKRESGDDHWRDYRLCSSNETHVISGSDSYLDLKLIPLNPPILARWVRIYPYSEKPMLVCAKFGFYGCRYSVGLVEYKIPEGNFFRFGIAGNMAPLEFRDRCYDGQHDHHGNVLHRGLGCLADFKVNTTLEPAFFNSRLKDCFVGWNRTQWKNSQASSGNSGVVDLIFRFQELRNFSSVLIHALELPAQRIRVPRRIEALFSVDGVTFADKPDLHLDLRDTGPIISVELDHKLGRFVQLKLFFASDWLVLSEVRFISEKASAMIPSALPPANSVEFSNTNSIDGDGDADLYQAWSISAETTTSSQRASSHLLAADDTYPGGSTVLILILVFLCFFMLLLVGIACFSIAWMQKRRRQRPGHFCQETAKLKTAAGFRLPGLSLAGGGSSASVDSSRATGNYVSIPNTDASLQRYMAIPHFSGGEQNIDVLLGPCETDEKEPNRARGFFSSFASRLSSSKSPRNNNSTSILATDKAQYDQVLQTSSSPADIRFVETPSSHSSPSGVAQHQHQQPLLPPRNEPLVPIFQSKNQIPVHSVNGVLQIDLKRSHPSLIVNSHPIVRFPQDRLGSISNSDAVQQIGYFSTFNRLPNQQTQASIYPQDSSAVYQSVQGESDADSLATSTMSPEYASASILGMQFVPCGKVTTTHEYNTYADSIPSTAGEGARLITAPAAYLPPGGILCYPDVNGTHNLDGGGYELNLKQAANLWNRTLGVTPQNCLVANGFSPVNRSHSQQQFLQDSFWIAQQQAQMQQQTKEQSLSADPNSSSRRDKHDLNASSSTASDVLPPPTSSGIDPAIYGFIPVFN